LARSGHSGVIVDPDPHMLELARAKIADEPPRVRSRVEFVLGYGEDAHQLLGRQFDIVFCHSVLMYLRDLRPLLFALTQITRPEGLLSILSVNPEASAMRSGLQRRWIEAIAEVSKTCPIASRYVPSSKHSLALLCSILAERRFALAQWYGVGVFSDHLIEIADEEMQDVCDLEWASGLSDPYRLVARCFHALFTPTNT